MRLRRLFPILVLGIIAWHARATVHGSLQTVSNLKRNFVVQQQMNVIGNSIEFARTEEPSLEIPNDAEQFSNLIRRVATSRIGGDPALDPWGTPYGHYYQGQALTLISAGPDRTWYTADDVSVVFTLSN